MKIDFEFQTEFGTFRDALNIPDDQPLPPDAVLEQMKQQRLQNWLTFINTPPPPDQDPEPDFLDEVV